ncbi:VWA domain-containing protein [Candidatus Woesearchaeota archaeon]|nr:VWA domain-containing protein [Candidatus Woesearchaeota archaeon]
MDKKKPRTAFFILRSLIITLVILSIASPFILETKTVKGNPRITILVDNSSSMNLFEGNLGKELADKLKGKVPVTLRTIAVGDTSKIGDGILNNLERDENVLVITDGNSNSGKLLGDIMLLATSLNVTVSTLNLEPKQSDVAVDILGPAEAIRDTEEIFTIEVKSVGKEIPYTLEVKFDNRIVLAETSKGTKSFTIKQKLSEGYHKITAELVSVAKEDYFKQNNFQRKTVKVVPRPRVLYVTEKTSPLSNELGRIYDLSTVSTIPNDLSSYLSVVLNDIPANKLLPHIDKLSSYVSDGNGLLVVGGQSSYDRGGYKGSLIETLLPVKVGSGEEGEKSDVYVLLILDVSGTTGKVYNSQTRQYEVRDFDQVIKAQAVSVIDSLDKKTNVGVVVIGVKPVGTIVTLSEIVTIGDKKKEIIDKISKIDRDKVGGQTEIKLGMDKAFKMLRGASGGKNVVLLSDGRGINPAPQQEVIDTTRTLTSRGIKTYVVGVGASADQDHSFLSKIAQTGQGVYFPIDASNKLKILFGEADESENKDFLNKLVLLDTTHFITYNQSLNAVVSGYNFMIPKPASRLLITTNKKIPILAAWRFGLGRVASFGTDDGSKWSGEILGKENSKVLTRTINWVIGDLSRKKNFDVKIKDVSLGDTLFVNVISNSLPEHGQLDFVKSDVNLYTSTFEPNKAQFYNFFGADVAVTYKEEFKNLGVNNQFLQLVEQTQGKVFDKEDLDSILEFIKEKSKRIKIDSSSFRWPFLVAALILFLFEIGLRRLWENKSYT